MAEVISGLVRIPQKFFDDHYWRDLPTPEIVRKTKTHYFIRRDDPNWPELVDDGQYYADPNGTDCEHSIRMAAHAMLTAMGEPTTYKRGIYKKDF
jgi:hypothetical protein